jgi:hypothetical protein
MDINSLIDVLGKWRWMSGVSSNNQDEDDVAKELVLLSKFVLSNYNNLTIEEINLAIDLSLTDKLDCDVRTYNTFSPMYVSRILNAYKDYKKRMFKSIKERKDADENKRALISVVTPQIKMDGMIDLIKMFYEEYKSIGVVNDYFNAVFFFLKRTNRIKLEKNVIEDAKEYGRIKSREHINSYFANAIGDEKPNKEDIEKRFSRNYCVQVYFDTLNLEELLSQITIAEFTDV